MNRNYHFQNFVMACDVGVDVLVRELCVFVRDDVDVTPNRMRDALDHIDDPFSPERSRNRNHLNDRLYHSLDGQVESIPFHIHDVIDHNHVVQVGDDPYHSRDGLVVHDALVHSHDGLVVHGALDHTLDDLYHNRVEDAHDVPDSDEKLVVWADLDCDVVVVDDVPNHSHDVVVPVDDVPDRIPNDLKHVFFVDHEDDAVISDLQHDPDVLSSIIHAVSLVDDFQLDGGRNHTHHDLRNDLHRNDDQCLDCRSRQIDHAQSHIVHDHSAIVSDEVEYHAHNAVADEDEHHAHNAIANDEVEYHVHRHDALAHPNLVVRNLHRSEDHIRCRSLNHY